MLVKANFQLRRAIDIRNAILELWSRKVNVFGILFVVGLVLVVAAAFAFTFFRIVCMTGGHEIDCNLDNARNFEVLAFPYREYSYFLLLLGIGLLIFVITYTCTHDRLKGRKLISIGPTE